MEWSTGYGGRPGTSPYGGDRGATGPRDRGARPTCDPPRTVPVGRDRRASGGPVGHGDRDQVVAPTG